MNAVRAVGATRHDTVQEAHRLAFLQHLDPLVAHARQALGQSGELVIVGGEQRAAAEPGRFVQVLDHRLRDGQAVVRRRPPPHLVEDHEGRLGRVVEDVCGLGHLDHERRHP